MKVCIVAVPYDSGRRDERMGAGPLVLLPPLEARLSRDGHQVRHELVELDTATFPIEIQASFELARECSRRVGAAVETGELPILLSGNCNGAVGALAGLGVGPGGTGNGLAWFDAHGDINTPETTETGYLDGMGLAVALGWCWRRIAATVPGHQPLAAENVLLLGVRDLDAAEEELVASSAVHALGPEQLAGQLGPALDDLSGPVDGIYLHLDLDVLDPSAGTANQLPVAGGLSVDELERAIVEIGSRIAIQGLGLASYDPQCDRDGRVATAAVSLLATAVGHSDAPARSRTAI